MIKSYYRIYIMLFFTLISSETFADRTINSATVDGALTTSVLAGATITTAVNVSTSGNGTNDDWNATGWRIDTTSGALICSDHADETEDSTTTKTFNITAPTTDGTYNLYLSAYKDDSCNSGASSEFVLNNAVTVTGGTSPASELLCSAELGNAVLNEIQTFDNFIEIYLLTSTDILNWALYVDTTKIATLGTGSCEINGTFAKDNTGTGATNTIFPAGTFITCDYNVNPSNNEILLVDTNGSFANGDAVVIDYIGYGNLTPSAKWEVDASCGSLYPEHNANNKDIARIPDGTGALEDNGVNSTKGITNVGPTTVDHYQLYHDGIGLTCLAEPITVKACANSDCSSLFTDDITATLSIGGTSNNVTISGGQLDYEFDYTGTGTAEVSLNNPSQSANVDCYVNGVLDASCEITFTDSQLLLTVPTLTACKSATATIKAITTDPNDNSCKTAISGNRDIYFWSNYTSPSSGTNNVAINNTDITTSAPGTATNLQFSSDGEASFDITYPDAGQLTLSATYSAANGKTMSGTSSPFVSKPVALVVYSNDSNADCTANDASCSVFKKAGEAFNLKVDAACWTDDSDSDFTDNPLTPNFELSSIINNHNVVAPSGGASGSISNTSFTFLTSDNGSHSLSQTVSEVGVFEFGITTPSYYGENLTTVTSPAIGRFYPDHFELTTLSNGTFGANACTGFSYSGQDFNYQTAPQLTVTAYSAASPATITQNYTGDFAKLASTDFNLTTPTTDANQLGADATNLVRLLWTPDGPSLTDNGDGSLTFAFGNDSYNYLHEPNSLIAEFTNAVDLTFTAISDSDGVDSQGLPYTLQPAGENIRFGRFAINNAHGSELAPLSVILTAEYFNGINWVDNTADQCTTLSLASDLQLANPDTASGSWQSGTTTMTIANGTTSATLSNNVPLLNGQATLTLSAPGEDNEGYVDIKSLLSVTNFWLLGDYDNDGIYDDDAIGRASFGLFKGSDNIIFRRELY